jgi:hypothetical protein
MRAGIFAGTCGGVGAEGGGGGGGGELGPTGGGGGGGVTGVAGQSPLALHALLQSAEQCPPEVPDGKPPHWSVLPHLLQQHMAVAGAAARVAGCDAATIRTSPQLVHTCEVSSASHRLPSHTQERTRLEAGDRRSGSRWWRRRRWRQQRRPTRRQRQAAGSSGGRWRRSWRRRQQAAAGDSGGGGSRRQRQEQQAASSGGRCAAVADEEQRMRGRGEAAYQERRYSPGAACAGSSS